MDYKVKKYLKTSGGELKENSGMRLLENKMIYQTCWILFLWGAIYYGPPLFYSESSLISKVVYLFFFVIICIILELWDKKYFAEDSKEKEKLEEKLAQPKIRKKKKRKLNKGSNRVLSYKAIESRDITEERLEPIVSQMTLHDFEKWSAFLFSESYQIIKDFYRWRWYRSFWGNINYIIQLLKMLMDDISNDNYDGDIKKVREKIVFLQELVSNKHFDDKFGTCLLTFTMLYALPFQYIYITSDDDLTNKTLEELEKLDPELLDIGAERLPFWILESGLTKKSKEDFLKLAYNEAVKLVKDK